MATIVGVHGIGKYRYYAEAGNSAAGAAERMRAKWDRYLHAGLGSAAARDGRGYIAEVAYYAHHLAKPAAARARDPERMDAEAQRVLVEWAAQLKGVKEAAGESLTGALRWATEWLLERLEHRAVAFATLFCPEVAAYLESPNGPARTRSREVVAEVIRRNRPQVVIAHSLGSVVTYETLHANPDLEVELLITLGSPLGMRNVVFERLLPAPLGGMGGRPPGVKRWVNIADEDDIAAIPPSLRSCFTGVDQDTLVNLDWIDFHTVEKYLGCGALTPLLTPYL
ncbi:hypothetical protein HNP84_001684 [Thermocatellispora tengchongensis]|uniref:Serine peptidase n=1 Tax=Thermocatellispora tengchongensis TaxID=1073253 RepID=A0A840P252_9ACTN|nr:hypothetical protein [Thermocatellispora tengchongensis]MBB5131971.1 hypothetical protein [Thermocatellispora tengchongensis]